MNKVYDDRYKGLLVFIILTFLGLILNYCAPQNSIMLKIWNALDVSFSVSLGVIAFLGYGEFIKSEDRIEIYFYVDGKEEKPTGLSLLRKNCNRGEVMGIMGMLHRTTKERFELSQESLPKFLEMLQEVQKGNKDKVLIPISSKDFKQFKIV